jgi:uncharacterized membrane protein
MRERMAAAFKEQAHKGEDGPMEDKRQHQIYERKNDPVRVLALSDGVFAIVITLLVLELQIPDLTRGQTLGDALQEVWPSFVAFIISFIVVAIAWAGHRDLFSLIQRTDRALVWFNIVYLLPLSILPFGASLIARYGSDPTALSMFGILLVAGAAARLAIWIYATGRSNLLFKPVDVRTRWVGVAIAGVPAIAYAVAIAIAEEDPSASLAIYAAGPVLYFITIWLARSSAPEGTEEQGFT